MITTKLVAVALTGGLVGFAHGPAHADAPEAAADTMRLELRDSVTVNQPGATAAFSVEPSVAEASASGGRVTIIARGVGSTTISVVTATGVSSLPVTVVSPAQLGAAAAMFASSRQWTQWRGHYESSTARLTNSVELMDGEDRRTLRAYAVNVLRLDARSSSELDTRTALPSLALEWRSQGNEVVVFDKMVDHSPLTLDGTTVRGVHARIGGAELHAGVVSPFLYQSVFLSTKREAVLGASYRLRVGRSSFTPNVYTYPSEPQTGGSKGTMGSMLYGYATTDSRLQLRGELGWSGELGGAGELSYHGARQRAWLSARHQPQGFAALGIGRPVGSTADAVWTTEPDGSLTFNATGNASRFHTSAGRQDIVATSAEARVKLVPSLAVSTGVSAGWFGSDTMAETTRSVTVPAGVHVDVPHFGASAVYRYQFHSARNEGGHGGRLSMRANYESFYASAFADAQQDAATLELILRDEPALAQLLNELGLTVATPEDLARLLRENAVLRELGFIEGVNLEFNPWRAQAGGELAWLPRDHARQQLRVRLLLDRTQTVAGRRDTKSVSLSYARRLATSIDMTSALSWWSRDGGMSAALDSWSVAVGLGVRFDSVPRLPSWRRDIDGVVVDESGSGAPVAGASIRLDGSRTAVSDASGRFVFTDVDGGEHRVEADRPDDAYFTGPSEVTARPGDSVRFTIARASAHLTGVVSDDVGTGIAGVRIVVRRGTDSYTVTTDSNGRFRFATQPGDYVLDPVRESLPAGYDVTAATARAIQLDADKPLQSDLVIPASRSIAGTIRTPAAAGAASVTLVELGRTGTIDADGRYVFRGLKPGSYTIEVIIAGRSMRRVIELPATPTAVHDIDFP